MNNRIYTIIKNNKHYPDLLKTIKDPPEKLYIKGKLELLNQKAIAIVGSRRCTEYGREIAKEIAKELCNNGIVIVSGLALRNRYTSTFRCIGIKNWKDNRSFG